MKMSKILALALSVVMVLALSVPAFAAEDSDYYGPIYDEWSEMTTDELYQAALDEADGEPIRIYATSSKMLKVEEVA